MNFLKWFKWYRKWRGGTWTKVHWYAHSTHFPYDDWYRNSTSDYLSYPWTTALKVLCVEKY